MSRSARSNASTNAARSSVVKSGRGRKSRTCEIIRGAWARGALALRAFGNVRAGLCVLHLAAIPGCVFLRVPVDYLPRAVRDAEPGRRVLPREIPRDVRAKTTSESRRYWSGAVVRAWEGAPPAHVRGMRLVFDRSESSRTRNEEARRDCIAYSRFSFSTNVVRFRLSSLAAFPLFPPVRSSES